MMIKKFLLPFFLCVSGSLFADSNVTISLINHSNHTFLFDHASVEFPGNTLAIDKKSIAPGETATIFGSTDTHSDLSGFLYFDKGSRFLIIDKRQFHIGQSLFAMLSNFTKSTLISRTHNPVIGPRLLMVVAAKVEVKDR